jgi:hypothetical protein
MRVTALTPAVSAAPGDTVDARLRIHHEGPKPAVYTVTVLGLATTPPPLGGPPIPGAPTTGPAPVAGGAGAPGAAAPVTRVGPIAPGASAEIGVPLHVPVVTVSGDHAIALEVRSDRRDDVPVIVTMTLSVGTFEKVSINVSPSTIAGRRHARFRVDVTNRRSNTVTVGLHGEGPDLKVQLRPPQVTLRPGQRVFVDGRVKGPSHVFGEKIQHLLTIVATGQGTPAYSSAAFQQRPTIPARLRTFTAILAVVSLWAGIAGGLAWWWSQNDRNGGDTEQVADDGTLDGLDPDGSGTGGTDGGGGGTGQDGGGSGGGGSGGGGGGAAGEDGAGEPTGPITTSVSGTVSAGDAGAAEGVTVRLTPLGPEPMTELPEPAPQALRSGPGRAVTVDPEGGDTAAAAASPAAGGSTGDASGDPTKFWSARYGFYEPAGLLNQVDTTTISDATTNVEGAFSFDGVRVGRAYELFFSKPGFDSRAYVVVPTADGGPIDLEIVMTPGLGEISGIVTGDNGPLGGVRIAITDGTLVFTTTSSTVGGSIGSWSFTGLSTPGTYTLTAETRGFGTQVLQVPLQAGEARSGVSIQMQRGVGSILGSVTGNVDNRVQRLGGITITASNGDVTRTTTTVTEGDVGSFAFPNLPIPGDWTVTAEAPGFVSQTRRVTATGNVTGVDFNLTRTTATVTGRVISDREGPLASAAVVVSRDGLSFRANTFAAGDVGGFNIPDLPPGDYRIAFSRFDHPEVSRQITVTAGQTLDLGNVFLQYAERPEFEASARIEVRIIDGLNLDLTGATVRLVEQRTGTEIRSITDTANQQASFTLEDIPPGTYRLIATKSGYRTVDRRISVGTGLLTEQIQLLRLGQAAGQIVDRFADPTSDDRLLNDYTLRIFRVAGSFEEPVETITVPITQDPEFDATVQGNVLRWETEPQSLTTGLYRIEVIVPPAGYSIIPNQVIDDVNLLPTDPQAFHFRIPNDNDEPIVLDDIFAVQFPSVTGRLLAPELTGTSPNTVALPPLPAANAEVTLTCGENSAAVGVDADSRFTFSPAIISENELLGLCTISATADGYRPASADLAAPIEISNGATLTDRVLDLVMLSTNSEAFAGKVAWIDQRNGNEYSLATSFPVVEPPAAGGTTQTDVAIVSTTPAIVAFDAGDGGPGGTGAAAGADEEPAGAISIVSVDGGWNLGGADPRQVFGRTTYSFTPTATRPSASGPTGTPYVADWDVGFEIDQNGITAVGAVPCPAPPVPPAPLAPLVVPLVCEEDNGSFSVFLDPADGRIQTSFELITSDSSPSMDGFEVTATAPDGTATVYRPGDPEFSEYGGPGAGIIIEPAMAGTWMLEVTAPPEYTEVFSNPSVFVDAGEDVRADSIATFIADSRLTVNITDLKFDGLGAPDFDPIVVDTVDGDGNPITIRPTVTLFESGNPVPVVPPAAASADGLVTFGPFTYPAAQPFRNYVVRVEMPGYDTGAASITVGNFELLSTDARTIPVELEAGDRETVTVRLPEFGSLIGTAVGQIGADPVTNALRIPDGLQVIATRVGTPTNPGEILVQAVDGAAAGDQLRFRVAGPAGCYQLELRYPGYTIEQFPAPTFADPRCPDGGFLLLPGEQSNLGDLVGNLVLAAVPGTIQLELLEKFGEIDGSTVDFSNRVLREELDAGDPPTVDPNIDIRISVTPIGSAIAIPVTERVDSEGRVDISGLLPGSYTLAIEVDDTSVDPPLIRNFPLQAQVTVPFGTEPDVGGELPVTAVLPKVGGAIEGTVFVVNNDLNQRLPLPAGLTVTQSFDDAPDVQVPGDDVENTATIAGVSATVGAPAGPPAELPAECQGIATGCGLYELSPVPAGLNRLTFSTAAGYTITSVVDEPAPGVREVFATGINAVTAPSVTYTANNVTVSVTVRSGDALTGAALTNASVALVQGTFTRTATHSGDGVYTFAGDQRVPPSPMPYELTVSAPDHSPETVTPINIGVQESGSQVLDPVGLAATTATINVNVDQQTGTSTPVDSENASVALFRLTAAPDTYVQVGASKLTSPAGLASFTVDTVGTYRVEVTKTGFATREAPAGTGEIQLGSTTAVPVLLPQLASYPITVSNVGSQPGSSSLRGETILPDTSIAATRGTGGSARVLTFSGLDPDVGYQFRIFSTDAGWRDQLVPATGTFDPVPGANPGQTISFTTLASATILVQTGTEGTPGDPVEGATVTATNPNYPTRTGTTDAEGFVTFSGNGGLNLGTWTITAAKDGVGATPILSPATVIIGNTGNPDQTELYLEPRDLVYTFDVRVTTATGAALNGATVTFNGCAATTGAPPGGTPTGCQQVTDAAAPGIASFGVLETLSSLGYTVSHPDYLTVSASAPASVGAANVTVTVPMQVRPVIGGTITRPDGDDVGTDPDPVATATVRISNGTTFVETTSGPDGTYSFAKTGAPTFGLFDAGSGPWTVTAWTASDAGIGSAITITTSSPPTLTSNILLVPLATTTFTVTGPDGADEGTADDPVTNAAVAVTGVPILGFAPLPSCTTDATGTCTVLLPAYLNTLTITYSVTAEGFVTLTGATATPGAITVPRLTSTTPPPVDPPVEGP